MRHLFDVLTVTDCRLPGGTASSTAEEINAQSRTDLRSGLLHVDSPLVSRTRPINARLRRHVESGRVTNVLPVDQVECDLVVVRHPKVALAIDPERTPAVRAGQCVVVVNQVPTIGTNHVYSLAAVSEAIENWLGVAPRFAPIGPLVRDAVRAHDPERELEPDDWVNVIDVDEWRSSRPRTPGSPIVVGRHSRDHYIKFPNSRQQLLAAYPPASDFRIRMLGGRNQIAHLLGDRTPRNWEVLDFDQVEPRRFLDELDVYAYFHHPDLVEAFGRNMLEALANGVPVVTHPHFASLFADAIVPSTPDGAESAIRELVGDRDRYLHQIEAGRELVERRFSYPTHVTRLEELLGRPVSRRAHVDTESRPRVDGKTVLFIGPNGAGLGHLTRLMAMARRTADGLRPHFFTFSTAAETVEQQGFPVTYFPSRTVTGSTSMAWHAALAERLHDLLDEIDPVAVVIDSTEPYRGLLMCLCDRPEIPVVWSRRGMWKSGVSNAVLESGEEFFDLVLEPGDLAAESDRGRTRSSTRARALAPITLFDRDELDDRAQARRFLGLGDDQVGVLVQLGAGNINDTSEELRGVLEGLADLPHAKIFVVRAPITTSIDHHDPRVVVLEHYPLGRIMRGFDFAVAAAGYNTVHELVAAELPAVLVPNTSTITDDQEARASWARDAGLALVPESSSAQDIGVMVKHLTIDENRIALRENLRSVSWPSGSRAATAAIADLSSTFDRSDPTRRARRARAYTAVEATIATRAARKRTRAADRQSRRSRRTLAGRFRALAVRAGRRGKRWALRRLGYQRLLALHTLLPNGVRNRLEKLTGTTPGRGGSDPMSLRIPPGRLMDDVDEGRLVSIAFVVAEGVDNDALADAVAGLQSTMRNFRPLFVCRSLRSRGFRRYGYVWEHDSSTGSRLERILHWYRPDIVVEIDDVTRISDPTSPFQSWLRSRPIE